MQFDNSRPNVILLADRTEMLVMPKTLGVYKVAHSLRKAGFSVQVIEHLSVFSVSELCDILHAMVNEKTLFVGISDYFYKRIDNYELDMHGNASLCDADPGSFLPHGRHYNDRIKQAIIGKNPRCKLVLGGPSAHDVIHHKDYDFIVIGYSEMSAVNLARHLVDPSVSLDPCYKSIFGPVVLTDSRALGYDFQNSDFKYAENDGILPGETLMLEVSRGCIFRCAFCSFPMNNKSKFDYVRNMDLLRQELIDNWHRFGVTRYKFADDTVNDSVEKCKMLAEMVSSLPFELEWWGYIRLDLLTAHPETIDYLFDSGLRAAFFGIETLYPRTAAAIGKGGDRSRQIKTLTYIKQKYGDRVSLHGSFIFGLPHEPVESMIDTRNWLCSADCPLDTWSVSPLRINYIANPSSTAFGFFSDIELNYAKYGYQQLDTRHWSDNQTKNLFGTRNGILIWQNEHTDFLSVEKMCYETQQYFQSKHPKPDGIWAFDWASLGYDIKDYLHRWPDVKEYYLAELKKISKIKTYRRLIESYSGVKLNNERLPQSFSEMVKSSYLLQ